MYKTEEGAESYCGSDIFESRTYLSRNVTVRFDADGSATEDGFRIAFHRADGNYV